MSNTTLLLTILVASAGCSVLIGDDELTPAGTSPPAIAITSPLSGTAVSSVVAVFATASPAAASVRFDFPDGASITDGAPPFSVAWDSTTIADGSYPIVATVTDVYGVASTASVTILVANGAPDTCRDSTFAARDLPRIIPDDSPIGAASSLVVTDHARVASLLLSLRIVHPYPSDLIATLISPSGGEYPINDLVGDRAGVGIIVDDRVISAFNGQDAAGLWTLAVHDVVQGDVGTLDAWSLSIAEDCNPIARRTSGASAGSTSTSAGSTSTSE